MTQKVLRLAKETGESTTSTARLADERALVNISSDTVVRSSMDSFEMAGI